MATVAQRLNMADHGRRMTLEEFDEAGCEEGFRYELARGILEVTYVPGEPHGLVVWYLLRRIAAYDSAHPGVIFRAGGAAEFRLWLPGMVSGRNPDVAVVLNGSPRDPRQFRRAALVMEVVSSGDEARHRDYIAKLEEYLAYGALEYWIVDPEMRRVTVLTRDGNAWVEAVFLDGQAASGLVLPGFAVPVVDLWAIPADEQAQH